MAFKCDLCGKAPLVGNQVSHANNKTKKRTLPNLQRLRALVDGSHKHLRVCTRCLKAGKVTKAASPQPRCWTCARREKRCAKLAESTSSSCSFRRRTRRSWSGPS